MANYPYKRPGTQLDDFREDLIKFQEDVEQDMRQTAGAVPEAQAAKLLAEEAKTQAAAADTKSASVQEQLDTLVLEGDSSIEAAQARVAADQTFNTLKDRLDSRDQLMAEKATLTEQDLLNKAEGQRDFLELKNRHQHTLGENQYEIIGDRDVNFHFPCSVNEFIKVHFQKDAQDDFIKMREFDIFKEGEIKKEQKNYESVVNGVLSATNTSNPYATTLDTEILIPFIGTGIDIQHFYDDRGGVWRAEIDGVFAKNISTHINGVPTNERYIPASSWARRPVARGLSNGNHVLKLIFKKDDPNNPPSSGTGTSRGWIKSNVANGSADQETAVIYHFSLGLDKRLLHPTSNKEFAINLKPNESASSTQWIPEHNNIGTVFLGAAGYQKLLVDGQEVNMSILKGKTNFKEAQMIQVLDVTFPNENSPLGKLFLTTSISRGKVSFTGKIKWLRDTFLNAGYVIMLPADSGFAKRCVTSLGKVVESTKSDNSETEFYEKDSSDSYVFVSTEDNYKDFFVGIKINSPYETLRKGQEGRRNGNTISGATWLQHRNDGIIQKLYPQVFQGGYVYTSGSSYNFEGDYFAGKIPNVRDLLI